MWPFIAYSFLACWCSKDTTQLKRNARDVILYYGITVGVFSVSRARIMFKQLPNQIIFFDVNLPNTIS